MQHRINSPSVISESIDGEVVVIHLATGTYYSLRGTAARIWDVAASGRTTDEVAKDLAASFDADGVDLGRETDTFLGTLVTEGLMVASEVDPSTTDLDALAARQPWTTPVLETFTDMQDLILLDPVHEVEPTRGWPASGEPAGG
jgi:Coenzyme PQQ synthesis protein D (PqqD)